MDYFPLFLNIRGARCVLVGGGDIAARKLELLLRAGAAAHVVAPELSEAVAAQVAGGVVSHRAGEYAASDLEGARLVIAATEQHLVNAQVAADATSQGVLVNVVDAPDLCTAIMPAIVDRSPVVIAISSSASAPVLARRVRAQIEAVLPARLGELARLFASFREAVKQHLSDVAQRRMFWERVLDGEIAEFVRSGQDARAQAALQALLTETPAASLNCGELHLVGTGPGDPDLLSFRAQRLMQRADVVLHEPAMAAAVLDRCRRDASRVSLAYALSDVNDQQLAKLVELCVTHTQAGRFTCVLGVGDVFRGQAGERFRHACSARGISCSVVAGISVTP